MYLRQLAQSLLLVSFHVIGKDATSGRVVSVVRTCSPRLWRDGGRTQIVPLSILLKATQEMIIKQYVAGQKRTSTLLIWFPHLEPAPQDTSGFSLVGIMTHHVPVQMTSCIGIFSSPLSKMKFLGQRLTFPQFLSIYRQIVNRQIKAN